jgi:hypothetical protein
VRALQARPAEAKGQLVCSNRVETAAQRCWARPSVGGTCGGHSSRCRLSSQGERERERGRKCGRETGTATEGERHREYSPRSTQRHRQSFATRNGTAAFGSHSNCRGKRIRGRSLALAWFGRYIRTKQQLLLRGDHDCANCGRTR